MTRVIIPDRGMFTDPDDLAAYDLVVERRSKQQSWRLAMENIWEYSPFDYYGALLHSPQLAAAVDNRAHFFHSQSRTGGAGWTSHDKEWGDLVIAQEMGNNIIWAHHVDAETRGLRPEAVRALRHGKDEDFTHEELRLVEYCRAVIHGTVTDQQFAAMKARMGERGLVEFTVFLTTIIASTRTMQAFGTRAPSDEWIDQKLAELARRRRATA
jgi:hypothetical protein